MLSILDSVRPFLSGTLEELGKRPPSRIAMQVEYQDRIGRR